MTINIKPSKYFHILAKSLLEAVMKKIKARRAQDFRLVFSQLDESPIVLDPAENNPELLKKLDENREVRRSEDEVRSLNRSIYQSTELSLIRII